MPRNGSGTYSRSDGVRTGSTIHAQQKTAGIKIRADLTDTEIEDVASALTASLAKDGQTTPTANLPMGGFKHTNVGEATARTDYARASQIQDGTLTIVTSNGGAANAYTGNISPAPSSYTAGMRILFTANHTNTGAATFNLNALGAQNIRTKRSGSVALGASAIVSGHLYELYYDGTQFRFMTDKEGWQTWTPTYSAVGAMTYTSVTTDHARYQYDGEEIVFTLVAHGTTGGTANSALTATLPVTTTEDQRAFAGWTTEGSGAFGALARLAAPLLEVRKFDGSNYTLGTDRYMAASGRYRWV